MLAFCHTPKAAGTSVKQMLRSWYGLNHYDIPQTRGRFQFITAKDIEWILKRWPHIQCIASHNLSPSQELGNDQVQVDWFTLLREPVKRYVSHYQFYVNRWWGYEKIPFEDWLQLEHHQNTQVKMLAGSGDLDKAIDILSNRISVVGLQEHYVDSMMMLAAFADKTYVPEQARKPKNTAKSRHIEEKIFDDFERYEKLIRQANDLDLKMYEFALNEVFPMQKAHLLADYHPSDANINSARQHMKINRALNFIVRNGIRRPMRSKVSCMLGIGNKDL